MNNPLDKFKPAVRALSAYNLPPYRAGTKINQNENPWDMPEPIKSEVRRRLENRPWSRYPDFVPASLLERLAALAGWRTEGTLAGNGSNELIQAVLMVSVGPGTRVLIAEPTFTLYRQIVTVLGGEVVSNPLTSTFQFDVDAIRRRAASGDIDVIVLCSPNNPTGNCICTEDVREVAASFPGLLIIDEAYHEFSGQTLVPLLSELGNLIVLRTFSKAMSMAGLRVGYMLSSPEIVREVHKATLPYNLNFYSSTAAEVACENYALLVPQIEEIIHQREVLFQALVQADQVEPVASRANFMLLRTPLSPRILFEELLARDILIRDVSRYPMLADYVRVSVGSHDENKKLVASIKQIVPQA